MIFDEVVEKAVEETQGGLAAVIMARDGISISNYVKPEAGMDLETLGIEYANLLSEVARSSEAMQAGRLLEMTLETDRYTTIIRNITDEYFMALIMAPRANLGKGRFILRVSSPSILKEL